MPLPCAKKMKATNKFINSNLSTKSTKAIGERETKFNCRVDKRSASTIISY
jgi:hypothetical protein